MRMVYSVQYTKVCVHGAVYRDMEIEGITGIIEGMFRSCGSWAHIHARLERQLLPEADGPFVNAG